MANPTRTSATHRGRLRQITLWVAISLATLLLLIALFPAYPLIVLNWLPREMWLAARPDHVAGDEIHRLHSLALSVLAWGMLLGIILQLRRPDRKVSALLASLAVPIAIAVAEMLSDTFTVTGTAPFFILILLVIAAHPAAGDILRFPRWNIPMLGLDAVAALPWMVYAARMGKAAQQTIAGFEVDHLTFMSAVAILVILWGIIGASNRAAWQYAAGAAVAAAACLALQSVIFTDALSALSLPWAGAALVWCVAYGGAAIVRARA